MNVIDYIIDEVLGRKAERMRPSRKYFVVALEYIIDKILRSESDFVVIRPGSIYKRYYDVARASPGHYGLVCKYLARAGILIMYRKKTSGTVYYVHPEFLKFIREVFAHEMP